MCSSVAQHSPSWLAATAASQPPVGRRYHDSIASPIASCVSPEFAHRWGSRDRLRLPPLPPQAHPIRLGRNGSTSGVPPAADCQGGASAPRRCSWHTQRTLRVCHKPRIRQCSLVRMSSPAGGVAPHVLVRQPLAPGKPRSHPTDVAGGIPRDLVRKTRMANKDNQSREGTRDKSAFPPAAGSAGCTAR